MAVLIYHAFPNLLPGGFVGVDVFFVISGYLITGILLREQDNGTFSFLKFYARRVRRLFPALFCVLTASLVFGWFCLFSDEYRLLGKHTFGGASFTANFFYWKGVGYWDVSRDLKPLLHLWSLGIEEQFYIFFPIFLFVVWKKRIPPFIFLTGLLLVSFALNLVFHRIEPALDFYSPFTRFWELLCGAILACMYRHQVFLNLCRGSVVRRLFLFDNSERGRRVFYDFVSLLGTLLLLAAVFCTEESYFPGFKALLPAAGTALLIFAGPSGCINRFIFSHHCMVGIGLISYPLYLWHWPLLSYAIILDGPYTGVWEWRLIRLACLAISFVLAFTTYSYIEKPIRFGKRKQNLKTFAAVCSIGAVGLLGLGVYAQNGFPGRFPQSELIEAQFKRAPASNSEGYAYAPELDELRCIYKSAGSDRTVALLGDSHAQFAFPGMADFNYGVGLNTFYVGLRPGVQDEKPEQFQMLFDVLRNKSDIKDVFLIYRGVLYMKGWDTDGYQTGLYPGYEAFLQNVINRLNGIGKRVYLVSENPVFAEHPKNFIKRPFRLCGTESFPVMALSEVREHQYDYLQMLARLENATVIYSLDSFCPDEECRMFSDNGVPRYYDRDHLSMDEGSRYQAEKVLAPYLEAIARDIP
ncbi:MAG: acyltransferase [Desulfovibrionaceae bacterium]|nr:acyltransferase [Desulfovibrionaceae bacterium]